MSDKVKVISGKIDKTIATLAAMEDGSMRATDAFNQLLTELLLTKIHKANLQAFQNVRDDFVELELHILYATPQGPARSLVGKIKCDYPLPTGDKLCDMINENLNKQLENGESALMLTLAEIRRLEQFAVKGSRRKFDPNAR